MIANIEKNMKVQQIILSEKHDATISCATYSNPQQIYQNQSNLSPQDMLDHQKAVSLPSRPLFELVDHDLNWKKSICKKAHINLGKNIKTSIHKKYSILAKINPKLSNSVKLITQQIRNQLLKQKEAQQNEHNIERIEIVRQEILPDKAILKESCYRSLLKPTQIDNDVPSDDEDLNMGIRYMYGELLYSVGSQMVNQREDKKQQKTKQIVKKEKKRSHNKQNFNTNLPQEATEKHKNIHKIQKQRQPQRNINRRTLNIRN